MHSDMPFVIFLRCLMPDDSTCQGDSAATQWVKIMLLYKMGNINAMLCYISILGRLAASQDG
jgi:hypothetical protein